MTVDKGSNQRPSSFLSNNGAVPLISAIYASRWPSCKPPINNDILTSQYQRSEPMARYEVLSIVQAALELIADDEQYA